MFYYYMTKKEYVFKVLDKVKWHWDKEPSVREYLNNYEDETYINYLYDKFTKAVDVTLEKQSQEKSELMSDYLDQLKIKESEIQQSDNEDLKKLDELLVNMWI